MKNWFFTQKKIGFSECPAARIIMKVNSKELRGVIEKILVLAEKEKDSLIVAEGQKDRVALEGLGFRRVIILNKPIYKVIEMIEATNKKKIILLTDLDKEGKRLYSAIKKELDKKGIVVDDRLRRLIFQTELRQIEGLSHYLKRFE